MLKAHVTYLKRGISFSIMLRGSDNILSALSHVRGGKVPVYGLIRDIVSDVRFYVVTEKDEFWFAYSFYVISRFIDSLDDRDWKDEERLTGKKEDFLNKWFADHLFSLSEEEKDARMREINMGKSNGSNMSEDDEADNALTGYSNSATRVMDKTYDCTNGCKPYDSELPEVLQDYEANVRWEEAHERKGNQGSLHRHGYGQGNPHCAEAFFLESIDPEIVEMAEKIGRSDSDTSDTAGYFMHSAKSDIAGITTGNDLNSLLPSELALLEDKKTENVFYQRYTQKRLQQFASASRSTGKKRLKYGPILMCVDTSSSMSGEPEILAKTLALAVAIVAQRKKRPLILVNYSCTVSFFVLTNLRKQRSHLLKFLSMSYGGGNNENIMFGFILREIHKLPRYQECLKILDGADLLVISDFEWGELNADVRRDLEEKHRAGLQTYALGVNDYLKEIGHKTMAEEHFNRYGGDGFSFFKGCDHRYVYDRSNGLSCL